MKPTKSAGSGLPLTGLLAKMRWVKVSRRAAPASAVKSIADEETVYGIRSSEDVVRPRTRTRAMR